MKKFYFALAAVAAILAGCSKEVDNLKPEPVTPGEKTVSLKASVGDPQTKVSSDNAGVFKWQDTDKITILTNNGNVRQFTIGEITDGTSAEFSGTIPDVSGETIKYALYPASASHFIDGTDKTDKKIRFHIDDRVIWDADASNMPMRAKVDGSASFKAVGGVLKLILFNIPDDADYLKFSATNKQISGDFEIADASISAPVIATDAKKDNNNEQVINFSANYSSSKVFYIPLPTGTIDGFTVALYETLEAEPLYTVTSTKSLSVTANKLIIAPVMNCASTPGPIDAMLTNGEMQEDLPTSAYGEGTIKSSSGNWAFVQARYMASKMQIRKLSDGGYLRLPSFGSNLLSITLNGVENGGGSAYSGKVSLYASTNTSEEAIASKTVSNIDEGNIEISIPENVNTDSGYLYSDGVIRFTSITVKFRGGYSAPVITAEANELIFEAGQISKNVAVSLVNAIDELGIGALVSGTNKDNFNAAIEGNTLTVTALAQNLTTANYTATITLRASGATAKTIAITQESSLTPTANPSISCSSNTIMIDCATAGATIYYTIGADAENTPDPTNASDVYDAENKPTIDTDSYVKAYAIADGHSASSIVGQAVSYVAPGTDVIYEKYSGILTEGDFIITSGTSVALKNELADNSNYIGYVSGITEYEANKIKNPSAAIVWHLAKVGDYWTIYNESAEKYAVSTGAKNRGNISDTNDDKAKWSVTCTAQSTSYDFVNKQNTASSVNATLRYNSGYGFATYSTSTGSALTLYKLQENDDRDEAGMSWSKDEATATYSTGNSLSFSAPKLTSGYATDITYESTDGAIATVAADGTVTITALSGNVVTEGSTTIKAIFAGNDDYKPQTVSYTLTVEDSREAVATPVFNPAAGNYTSAQNVTISCTTEDATIHYTTDGSAPTTASPVYSSAIPVSSTATIKAIAVKTGYKDSSVESALYTFGNDGSPEHPYTATDVLGITSANDVYVTGTISEVTEVNTTYHNATYKITDGESTILVYRGKFVNNTDFTSEDQIAENDQVIVFGNIGQYQSVSQLSQGNYIYSLNGITKALTAGTLSTSVNNDNKQITVTWGAASGSTETITYVVTCGSQTLSPNPTAAGSHTFTMADYGSYSISVVASADDAVSATASTTATLTDPGSTAKWNLVSTLSGIKNGTYAIAASNSSKYYTVPNTTISAQTFACLESSYSAADGLTPATGSGEFVFTAVSGISNAFYIYNTNLKKYLVATGSKTFGYVDSTSDDYGYWTFSTVSSGGFSGQFSVQHSNKTHYMRAYSNSVRCYDGQSNNGVYLFIYE